MTITEFLLARIAEWEATARAAIDEPRRGPWDPAVMAHDQVVDDGRWSVTDDERVEGATMIIYDEGGHTREQAEHIAAHDPARVLAQCEAMRQVVEALADLGALPDGERHEQRVTLGWVCQMYAAIWFDHPDYDQAWR